MNPVLTEWIVLVWFIKYVVRLLQQGALRAANQIDN